MKISIDSKLDAYYLAINYLLSEECSYDDDGDYKEGRIWLADKLKNEIKMLDKKNK